MCIGKSEGNPYIDKIETWKSFYWQIRAEDNNDISDKLRRVSGHDGRDPGRACQTETAVLGWAPIVK
jgi:hypothetical protein